MGTMKMSVLRARSYALKTQEDIAKELGITTRTYAKLEKQPEKFTVAQARVFARIVNIPVGDIIFEKEDKPHD